MFKVLIVKNRYKKKVNLKKGLDYLAKNTPLKLEIEEVSTDFDLEFKQVGNGSFKGVVPTNYYQELRKVAPIGKYDVVCLYYGNKAGGIRVSYTDNPIYPNTDIMVVVKEDSGDTFSHEFLHVLRNKLLRKGISVPDVMDKAGASGTYTATQNRDEQVKLFAPYWKEFEKPSIITKVIDAITPKPMYVYFKESEIVGLKPELVQMLDHARAIAEVPFRITSGFRTPEHNKEVNGAENSTHTTGLGCDILADTSEKKFRIIKGAIGAGFNRIGIYNRHIHLDCGKSPTHSENIIWVTDKD